MLPADAPLAERQASNGPALPGTRIRIVDPDTGALLESDRDGEIAVKLTEVAT